MEESARFYEELFGMRRLPTPKFQQPVLWLALGDQQLHLFQRDDVEAPRAHHLAIDVDDFNAFYREAKQRGLLDRTRGAARPATTRPAGCRCTSATRRGTSWRSTGRTCPRSTREIVAELGRLEDDVPQEGDAREATLYTAAAADGPHPPRRRSFAASRCCSRPPRERSRSSTSSSSRRRSTSSATATGRRRTSGRRSMTRSRSSRSCSTR